MSDELCTSEGRGGGCSGQANVPHMGGRVSYGGLRPQSRPPLCGASNQAMPLCAHLMSKLNAKEEKFGDNWTQEGCLLFGR